MKHKLETLQKYIRRGNAYLAFYGAMDPSEINLCVSYGNKKIGKVLNVSKAPIFTCKGVCKACKLFCYDIKACVQYVNVMEARMRNTVLFFKDRDLYFARIAEKMSKRRANKFLRYDVGGEIVDSDEVKRLANLLRRFNDFRGWTYTKNHAAVNALVKAESKIYLAIMNGSIPATKENFIKCREEVLPENLVIMFSNVNDEDIDKPFYFPVFNCVTDDENGREMEGVPYCDGDCTACRNECKGCVNGESRNVKEH